MKTLNEPTYISLFSSAGIGCYGFKLRAIYEIRHSGNNGASSWQYFLPPKLKKHH